VTGVQTCALPIYGVQVYIECGGNEDRSEEWKSEIASVIDTLTKSTNLDLSAITE
jgi:hypothetical protein